MPQVSILGLYYFFCISTTSEKQFQRSSMHYFADYTNTLFSHKVLKKINRYIDHDLFQTVQWLRASQISLNASKTEIILFQTNDKKVTKHISFKLSGQKVNSVIESKYLRVYLDENLFWNFQLNQIKSKLRRRCGLLAELMGYIKTEIGINNSLFCIFDPILRYAIQVWRKYKTQTIREIEKIPQNATRIMSSKPKTDPVNPHFIKLNIMELDVTLMYNNCMFVYGS